MLTNVMLPVGIVLTIGLVAGLILSIASKVFAVEVDETAVKLREALPGANCGGCGCAGCDEYAAKLAKGEVEPNLCTVGGAAVAAQLGEILGVDVGAVEAKKAVVRCRGHLQTTDYIMDYTGPKSCAVAKMYYGGRSSCNFACLGYGDCVNACPYNAISIKNNIASVDHSLCIGCGACAKACPQGILELVPATQKTWVACRSMENALNTRKNCTNGCLGCKKCERTCEFGAITVTDNRAHIDYSKCTNCGKCAEACPTHCIQSLLPKPEVAAGD